MTTQLQNMNAIPDDYILSKIFSYERTFVEIYTDGASYIFAYGGVDTELGRYYVTISEPARIGNAP